MSTPFARDLLRAARSDRPDAARRSRIWEAVATAPEVSIAAGTGAAAIVGSKAFGGLSAGKLLLLGALAGSLATVGVGSWWASSSMHAAAPPTRPALSIDRPSPVEAPPVEAPVVAVQPAVVPPRESGEPAVAPAPAHHAVSTPPVSMSGSRVASEAASGASPVSSEEALMREAALVSEARTLVVAGQTASALALLDAAAKGPSHSLEPEELSLRGRALRGAGRNREAEQVEETLRHRFPDHFLAQ